MREAKESISSSEEDSDNEEVESTTPLISDGETETEIDAVKNVDFSEARLAKRHKLKLVLSKGSVVVVSCSVLVVGVVLAGVIHLDYSSCWPDPGGCLQVSALLPTGCSLQHTL